eukprot:gene8792-1576_t
MGNAFRNKPGDDPEEAEGDHRHLRGWPSPPGCSAELQGAFLWVAEATGCVVAPTEQAVLPLVVGSPGWGFYCDSSKDGNEQNGASTDLACGCPVPCRGRLCPQPRPAGAPLGLRFRGQPRVLLHKKSSGWVCTWFTREDSLHQQNSLVSGPECCPVRWHGNWHLHTLPAPDLCVHHVVGQDEYEWIRPGAPVQAAARGANFFLLDDGQVAIHSDGWLIFDGQPASHSASPCTPSHQSLQRCPDFPHADTCTALRHAFLGELCTTCGVMCDPGAEVDLDLDCKIANALERERAGPGMFFAAPL